LLADLGSYSTVQDGPKTTIVNIMSNKKDNTDKSKLEHVVELLKFALSLDDEEIIKSTIESVIEILEEEIDK
jgi:hypothetical protein